MALVDLSVPEMRSAMQYVDPPWIHRVEGPSRSPVARSYHLGVRSSFGRADAIVTIAVKSAAYAETLQQRSEEPILM